MTVLGFGVYLDVGLGLRVRFRAKQAEDPAHTTCERQWHTCQLEQTRIVVCLLCVKG